MTSYTRESGLTVTGRGGRSLAEHWRGGARTLFGMQTHGFPNFFVLSIVQAGVSLNYLHTADAQSLYIADLVSHCVENGLCTVAPTAAADKHRVDLCIEQSAARPAFHKRFTHTSFTFKGAPPEH